MTIKEIKSPWLRRPVLVAFAAVTGLVFIVIAVAAVVWSILPGAWATLKMESTEAVKMFSEMAGTFKDAW